ncbi:YCF48-related protein [Pseudomonas sp. MT3]|uniref:YCF48-related protein n=1 Tax=Pseudomonas sp. ATCC 13867 TaxID=1294143 RepID=UPI0002C4F706|nr:YCF48-related protein [Pseudomonas sp. ATCC 13867]AGI25181.1 BNR/Asp-box repeat-containing protein [Pseudomonas sp. ATCC 13867]
MREPQWRTMSEQSVSETSRSFPMSRKSISLLGALSFLMLSVAPLPAFAATEAASDSSSIPSAKAASSLLLSVAHAGQRLVAVGDHGHILYSDDAGKNWVQAKVPTRQLLTSVFFINDKKGWAVGHDAQILASTDGGSTWTRQFEDLKREAPLLDIWFQDDNHGMAVGAYGALLETTDGGQHWEDVSDRLDNEDQYHLNSIAAVKDSGLLVVGESGSIFRSRDWGQTWEKLEGPYEGSLFGAVGTRQAGTALIYGLRGHLFRTTDFGDNWQQIELPTANGGELEFGLSEGSLLADGTIVVVGHGGSVLESRDDGQSFKVYNRPDRLSLAGVSGAGNGNLVLVGQGGIHLATATGAELTEQQ